VVADKSDDLSSIVAELTDIFRDIQPDVIHANSYAAAEAARALGVPSTTAIHSINPANAKINGADIADRAFRVSSAVPGDYPVIVTGIEPIEFTDERRDRLVVFAGRLDLDRNPDAFLQAFAAARLEVPEAKALIIGAGHYEGALDVEDALDRYGLKSHVEVTGLLPHDETRQLIATGDVIAAPWPEAFGLSVAEGMSAGLIPVVSSDGFGPQLVGDLGVTADPNVEAITEALVQALTDEGLRGARHDISARISQHFSATRFAAEYARVFEELA